VVAPLQRLDAAEITLADRVHGLRTAVNRARRLGVEVPDERDTRSVQLAFAEHVCRTGQKLVDGVEPLRRLHADHQQAVAVIVSLRAEHRGATEALLRARDRVAAAPEARARLEQELQAARGLVAQMPRWEAELDRMRAVHTAAAALPAAIARRECATVARDAAFAALNQAEAHLNRVMRARLEAAAAWLAGQLVTGDPCQVCGCIEHPAPHTQAGDAPDEQDEKRARAAAGAAAKAKRVTDERLTEAREQVARLHSVSGDRSAADVAAELVVLRQRLASAQAAGEELARTEEQLRRLEEQLDADRGELETCAGRVSALAERLAGILAHDGDRVAQLVETVGSGLDVDGYVERVRARDGAAQSVVASSRSVLSAEEERAGALSAAEGCAQSAAFQDLTDARAAILGPEEVECLRAAAQRRHDRRQRALGELAEPDVARALQVVAPDLGPMEAELTAARIEAAAAARTASVLGARLEDVISWEGAVDRACAEWQPLRRQSAVAEAMASLVEGQSADNQQRVSLSAYVLAARLQQVVAAANERLLPMSSGRYTLEHTMDRGAGDRRGAGGGLGLLVRDEWTGEARDPKTLSGGETFQASLALALGLSDVVTHEAGGVEMHTLFVDEGFGSLDADSLDDVMDVLDGLRAGGRRVGLVSHVDAMRERVPSQVCLVKTPTGSRVAQLTG
jgi:exonuclease SbcC